MKETIKNIRDFKIVPDKFRSATFFNVTEINQKDFVLELLKLDKNELDDYEIHHEVEIFGSGKEGLVYFTSFILDKKGNILTVSYPDKIRNIQRREYSRVKFEGEVRFVDFQPNTIVRTSDISAGGIKLLINVELTTDKVYDVIIKLENNLEIKCSIEPIRVAKNTAGEFVVNGRFLNIENVDRIALIQYTFKKILEVENKNNN